MSERNEDIEFKEVEKEGVEEAKLVKLGVDVGYGFTKFSDDRGGAKFPSVVGDYKEIDFDPGMNNKNKLDNLKVEIEGTRYFIGDLANRQSDITFSTVDKSRINSEENDILFESAIALSLPEEESRIKLTTGLPVSDLKDQKEILKDRLVGNHEVKIIKDDEEIIRRFKIENIKVIPQPFAALLNEILDDNGEIANPKLANSKVLIVDIGFWSVDILVIDNMEYIEKMSDSFDSGMSLAYKKIKDTLDDKHDISKEIYQIEKIIRNKEVRINDRPVDLTGLVNESFKFAAMKILSQVNSLVDDLKLFDQVLVVGGGAEALYDKMNFPHGNDKLADNSQYAILNGLNKFAERVF